jgi:transcriptional regulator with XRE-family HTH domain
VNNTIGKKIRQLRVLNGFSQENVADELGMSNGNYGKIERGDIDIDSTLLIKLAKVLKVSVGDFFEENIKPTITERKDDFYGFATKDDVASISNYIKSLSEELEKLRAEIKPKKTVQKKYASKSKK